MRGFLVSFAFTLLTGAMLAGAVPAHALEGRPAEGVKVFAKCTACHQVGPEARSVLGPALNGIVDRKAGTYPGYNYSAANKNSGLTWNEATLARYLKSPQTVVPKTKMIFPGLPNEQDAVDLIAYLKGFGADGKPK